MPISTAVSKARNNYFLNVKSHEQIWKNNNEKANYYLDVNRVYANHYLFYTGNINNKH